jgi:hypothetical protein
VIIQGKGKNKIQDAVLITPDLVNGHLNEAIFLDIREHRMKKNCKKTPIKMSNPTIFQCFFGSPCPTLRSNAIISACCVAVKTCV